MVVPLLPAADIPDRAALVLVELMDTPERANFRFAFMESAMEMCIRDSCMPGCGRL